MWDWFLHTWSSVGLGAAVVLGLLLFGTDVCRSRPAISRWRDPVWMAWAFVAAYLVHNFEEYGVDAEGRSFAFPAALCGLFGFHDPAECPVPTAFFAAVNVPLFWVALPLAALWSRRHPAVGMTGVGIVFVNAMSHIGEGIRHGYNPGLVTAVVIFLPLSIWAAAAFFGPGRLLRRPVLGVIVATSVLLHAVLLGLVAGQVHGVVGGLLACLVQALVAPVMLLALPWPAERIWPPTPQSANEPALAAH
ncbi:HXXEE domain-containing protein [uncultured Mycolicibacterium sp.]|uniref:HXXEE domain-containing protein n=1 Tax=uncultured Mycolicibacterium sp. TaxID=2320817 RepID=UPI00261952FF|nr:HXXEE domain-containing protein [uncultured Mycolicibacterium sp.]